MVEACSLIQIKYQKTNFVHSRSSWSLRSVLSAQEPWSSLLDHVIFRRTWTEMSGHALKMDVAVE